MYALAQITTDRANTKHFIPVCWQVDNTDEGDRVVKEIISKTESVEMKWLLRKGVHDMGTGPITRRPMRQKAKSGLAVEKIFSETALLEMEPVEMKPMMRKVILKMGRTQFPKDVGPRSRPIFTIVQLLFLL